MATENKPTRAPEPPAEKTDVGKKSSDSFSHPRLKDVTEEYLAKNVPIIIGGVKKPTKTED